MKTKLLLALFSFVFLLTPLGKVTVASESWIPLTSYVWLSFVEDFFHDFTEDEDKDGLKNSVERLIGTNPYKRDTDKDGFDDIVEIHNLNDPLSRETSSRIFTDVPVNDWSEPYIGNLVSRGVFTIKNTLFSPATPLTRAEAIKISLLTSEVPLSQSRHSDFTDVVTESWYFPYTQTAWERKIVEGVDKKFQPSRHITRAEAVKLLVSAFGGMIPNAPAAFQTFRDVSGNDWYSVLVEFSRLNGIAKGFDDNTFRPNELITRAQFSKMAVLMQQLFAFPELIIQPEILSQKDRGEEKHELLMEKRLKQIEEEQKMLAAKEEQKLKLLAEKESEESTIYLSKKQSFLFQQIEIDKAKELGDEK